MVLYAIIMHHKNGGRATDKREAHTSIFRLNKSETIFFREISMWKKKNKIAHDFSVFLG